MTKIFQPFTLVKENKKVTQLQIATSKFSDKS